MTVCCDEIYKCEVKLAHGGMYLLEVPGVNVIQQDAAAVDVIQAHEQLEDGGLAAATGAHQGNALPRLYSQAHPTHHLTLTRVPKSHILHVDTHMMMMFCVSGSLVTCSKLADCCLQQTM